MRATPKAVSILILVLAISAPGAMASLIPRGSIQCSQQTIEFHAQSQPLTVTFYINKGSAVGAVVARPDGGMVARAELSGSLRACNNQLAVHDFTGQGPEIVLVNLQKLLLVQAQIYQLRGGRLIKIWDGLSNGFEAIELDGRPVIAIQPYIEINLTVLCRWENGAFRSANDRYPQYYESLIESAWSKVKSPKDLTPDDIGVACDAGAAVLLLSGKYVEARSLCQKARDVVMHDPNLADGHPKRYMAGPHERGLAWSMIFSTLDRISKAEHRGLHYLPAA